MNRLLRPNHLHNNEWASFKLENNRDLTRSIFLYLPLSIRLNSMQSNNKHSMIGENMHIIAGKYKGRRLESPTEITVRPPLSRFRKAIFDTLMPFLPRGSYLDLFGGSGSFAFEALSRGATNAIITELNPITASLIQRNAKKIKIEEPIEIRTGDALLKLPQIAQESLKFSVIMVAPPYFKGLENKIMTLLDQTPILSPDGIITLQHPTNEAIHFEYKSFTHWKTKKYGNTSISYFLPNF